MTILVIEATPAFPVDTRYDVGVGDLRRFSYNIDLTHPSTIIEDILSGCPIDWGGATVSYCGYMVIYHGDYFDMPHDVRNKLKNKGLL